MVVSHQVCRATHAMAVPRRLTRKIREDKKRSRAGSEKPTGPTSRAGCVELVEDSRS